MNIGNIFKDVAKAEHTVAAWLEKELSVLYGNAPAITKVADAVLKYVGPALQIIVAAETGPAAAEEVGNIVREAQTDIAVASALIYDFGPTPQAANIIDGVVNNLNGLVTAGHVKNPANVAGLTKVVNSIGALSAVLSKKPTA
jgi:hypothetical protein